ncbi:MAG: hypothetical protein V2A34_08925, partial [Lentisphaerota bacterium]
VTKTSINLGTVSNMVDNFVTNIPVLVGSTGFVSRSGDAMTGDLNVSGANVFSVYYQNSFDSDPFTNGWMTTSGGGFYGAIYYATYHSIMCIPPFGAAYCAFTNTGLPMPTNVYRVTWTLDTTYGLNQSTNYLSYLNGLVTNHLLGGTQPVLTGAVATTLSSVFTGAWDKIELRVEQSASADGFLLTDFKIEQYAGTNLTLTADRIVAAISPWFRYSTHAPSSSADSASNYTISVVETNVYLCLTTNSFGAGTNWIALQGRFF